MYKGQMPIFGATMPTYELDHSFELSPRVCTQNFVNPLRIIQNIAVTERARKRASVGVSKTIPSISHLIRS